jgi:hypothetical protein
MGDITQVVSYGEVPEQIRQRIPACESVRVIRLTIGQDASYDGYQIKTRASGEVLKLMIDPVANNPADSVNLYATIPQQVILFGLQVASNIVLLLVNCEGFRGSACFKATRYTGLSQAISASMPSTGTMRTHQFFIDAWTPLCPDTVSGDTCLVSYANNSYQAKSILSLQGSNVHHHVEYTDSTWCQFAMAIPCCCFCLCPLIIAGLNGVDYPVRDLESPQLFVRAFGKPAIEVKFMMSLAPSDQLLTIGGKFPVFNEVTVRRLPVSQRA